MTLGSLFAGIGGFDLGFERAGFDVEWQVENDEFCRAVLAEHWPDVRRYGDVRSVCGPYADDADGRERLATVDVVCGGFPCQPHSTAGRRLGARDDRDLWPEFARIIRDVRPRWVVVENVTGILSIDAGRFFGTVLGDLAACGYDAEWDCIPASAVGALHRRDRVWVVAYPQRVADADERRREGKRVEEHTDESSESRNESDGRGSRRSRDGSPLTDADERRRENRRSESTRLFARSFDSTLGRVWKVEPDFRRVAPRVPARVDRLRVLGNAVVPQVAEWLARQIIDVDRMQG